MSDDRLDWFPCFPSKLLGALSGMKPDEGYVYWIVCLRIYEVGGPCRDSLDTLARRTGMNKRRVSEALDLSFQARRLVRQDDGIMNPFAEKVMADSRALRDERKRAGQEGGKRSAEKRKQKQTSESSKASILPKQNPTHLQLQEQDSLFPNGNRAVEPPPKAPVYTDSKHELWGEGVPILLGLGMKEKLARQMIGTWLKATRDDAQSVLSAIQRARDNRVQGPLEWITRSLNGGNNGRNETNRTDNSKVGFSGLAARLRRKIEADRDAQSSPLAGDAADREQADGGGNSASRVERVASVRRLPAPVATIIDAE